MSKKLTDLNEYFVQRYIPVTESGCWIWEKRLHNPRRYGLIGLRQKDRYAHRFSWRLHRGEIPDGLYVCHKCDIPECVNPDHLFLGTQAENIRDRNNKGRGGTVTESQVSEIRKLHAGGECQKDLAMKYSIDPSQVSRIVNQRAWK